MDHWNRNCGLDRGYGNWCLDAHSLGPSVVWLYVKAKPEFDENSGNWICFHCTHHFDEPDFPAVVAAQTVKWALVGVIASQLSTLFMQLRGGVSRKAMLGPIVLLIVTAVFWSILE